MLNKLNPNYLILLLSITQIRGDFTKSCPFIYTVDLTDSLFFPNGSYLYQNDTLMPPQFVRNYNYSILIDDPHDKKVRTHKRGCICAVKQCLPLCSDQLEVFYEKYKSKCVDYGFEKNVTYRGDLVKSKHLLKNFHLIYGRVCDLENGYMLAPELMANNEWTLYEDSVLLRHHDNHNLTINEYCFDIKILDDKYDFVINPIVCGETIIIPWFKISAMTFSIPFYIITMICNWYFNRSNKVGRKLFGIYLFFVTLSYTLICCYTISGVELGNKSCQIFGFAVYFTISAYLTWICILCYEFYKSVTVMIREEPSFGFYCLIGLMVPTLMTFLTFIAHISSLPGEWKPGMDSDMCAVNTLRWSALLYYYIPCIVVFVYSLTLYTRIIIFKRNHTKDKQQMSLPESETFMDSFVLFFRIFLFMGISWSLDIVSYFCRMAFGEQEYFIYIALDIFNAFHGFFVFLTFICRKSVLKQIKTQ